MTIGGGTAGGGRIISFNFATNLDLTGNWAALPRKKRHRLEPSEFDTFKTAGRKRLQVLM